jgi:hypothetical protein
MQKGCGLKVVSLTPHMHRLKPSEFRFRHVSSSSYDTQHMHRLKPSEFGFIDTGF